MTRLKNNDRHPKVPAHLEHMISRQGKWLCIPSHVVREVLQLIDPTATASSVCLRMNVDEANSRRMFDQKYLWVSEAKIDRLLVAFDCPHLWLEPPLNKYRLAILEYEELLLDSQELEAVA